MYPSPGELFRKALKQHFPLQIVGVINPYAALMAQDVGFKALYLSGAGVANSSYGLPDIGLTTLDDVLEDASRITQSVKLPLLVDIDTGWGNALMVERTIKAFMRAKVAAVHIEDQISNKRCGHLDNKQLISKEEMTEKIQAAHQVRLQEDPSFYLIARTDALAIEGLEGVIERGLQYKKAGADALFAEAFKNLNDYQTVKKAVGLPLLANMTEFGKTPLFTLDEFKDVGVDMILYPLSANRAMNKAALDVFKEIYTKGTQKKLIDRMQTRDELYQFLNYEGHKNGRN